MSLLEKIKNAVIEEVTDKLAECIHAGVMQQLEGLQIVEILLEKHIA